MYLVIAAVVILLILLRRRQIIIDFFILVVRSLYNLWNLEGPQNYPILGAIPGLKWDIVEFMFQIQQICRTVLRGNGLGMVRVWAGPFPVVYLLRSRHIKVLLESNTQLAKPWPYDMVTAWIGQGLLTRLIPFRDFHLPSFNTSDKWFSRRKIITPTFHFAVLKGYQDVFCAQGRIMVDQLENSADTGREVDVFAYIKKCALDIICETAMGTQLNSQTGGNVEYSDAVVRISEIVFDYSRFPWLWFKPIWYGSGRGFEFNRLVKLTRDFTLKARVIRERRQLMRDEGLLDDALSESTVPSKKSVFIDMLLLQQAAHNFSDEDIREEVDTFMFEGHDTTASAMGYVIWFLGQYPEYQRLVHQEIDDVFGEDSTRDPTEADLRKLSYLERCIKESMRMMPSVSQFGRALSHDLEIEGVTLPKGLTTFITPMATHRDPAHWEWPETYYPDHFLPEKVAARDPYSFIPFSAGPRNCIGQKFAIGEIKTVLSWFFRRYSVETVEPYPGNRPVPELILKPLLGFPVRLFKRR